MAPASASDAASRAALLAGMIGSNWPDTISTGLSRPWAGRVWLNPPYAAGVVDRFVEKLVGHVEAREVAAAVLLVHARTDVEWFHRAAGASARVCFTRGRVRFLRPGGDDPGAPTTGSAFLYFGPEPQTFKEVFSAFGWVAAGA